MIKKLLLLNGLAITAVLINHAAAFGLLAAINWPDQNMLLIQYLSGKAINLEQFLLLTLVQMCVFCVPAFIFVSGFFVAYASRGAQGQLTWKVIWEKVFHLLVPYVVWSLIALLFRYIVHYGGTTYTVGEIVKMFFFSGVLSHFSFIPALSYLYILSPFLIRFAKVRCKQFLLLAAAFQVSGVILHYLRRYGVDFPGLDELLYLTEPWLPTMWVLYFALGITFGLHLASFKSWLERSQGWIFSTLILASVLTMMEALLRFDPSRQGGYVAYYGTFSFLLYSIAFILSFLLLPKIPLARYLSYVGPKTLGIFLVHYMVIYVIARGIVEFVPSLLPYRVIIVVLLFLSGLGVPLLGMKLLTVPPLRKYYRYVFG